MSDWRQAALRNPCLRLVSSIPFGVGLLVAILVYASIGSAWPPVRAAIEMTEMQYFHHWLFGLMMVMFCVSLTLATILRVRWTLRNLGVLTVHTGLLMLTGGAIIYFGGKIEGDMLVTSPRVEVVMSRGADEQVAAQVLAEAGQKWETNAPMLGGQIAVEIVSTQDTGAQPVTSAAVRYALGVQPPQTVTLTADGAPVDLGAGLTLRLRSFGPVGTFYDRERAALHFRRVGETDWQYAELRGLPIYQERYLPVAGPLRDTAGREVSSARTWPHVPLWPGGPGLPTGWLEHWRMPVRVDAPDLPFTVAVDGYVPYVTQGIFIATPGGGRHNPGLNLTMTVAGAARDHTLFAADPRLSRIPLLVPVDFRWAATRSELERWSAAQAGPHELAIRIADPPVEQVLAVSAGQVIEVPGTDYRLTVERVEPGWPLATPGLEGVVTPMLSVVVQRGETRFTRTVLERFPHLSQDIDAAGVRHSDGPVDPNITLTYRSAPEGRVLLMAGPGVGRDNELVAAAFDRLGQVTLVPLMVGSPRALPDSVFPMTLEVTGLWAQARRDMVPVIEPVVLRRNLGPRAASAVRLHIRGRGAAGEWEERRWCFFSHYPEEEGRTPLVVTPPDGGPAWELSYSRVPHDLGAVVGLRKLSTTLFPGAESVSSWRSDLIVQPAGEAPADAAVYTNQTFTSHGWTLFQSGASQDRWSWSILGVGNRRGILPMTLGSVLITLGLLYAFYVKPLLLRRAARRGAKAPAGRAPQRASQLVEAQA